MRNCKCRVCEDIVQFIHRIDIPDGIERHYSCKNNHRIYCLDFKCIHCNQIMFFAGNTDVFSRETACLSCHRLTKVFQKKLLPKKEAKETIYSKFYSLFKLFNQEKLHLPDCLCPDCNINSIWVMCYRDKSVIVCINCHKKLKIDAKSEG